MYCAKCGNVVEEGAHSCSVCGTEIKAQMASGVPAGRTDAHVNKKGVTAAFTSANTLSILVTILLGTAIMVDIIAVVSDLAQINLLSGYFTGSEAEANDNRQAAIGMAQLGVLIVTAIFFLIWIYRAYKNLAALGAKNLKYSPGWAVGGWFVPFLNLVRPVQVVTEIWKASDPKVVDSASWRNSSLTVLIPAWWALWLIGNFIGYIVLRMTLTSETASELTASTWVLLISDAIDIPAAILAILVVRGINSRQEEKYRHLSTVAQ